MINKNIEIESELRCDKRRLTARRKFKKLDFSPLARKGCWLFVWAMLCPLALPTGQFYGVQSGALWET